jgi:four helix bundle protein
MNFAKHFEDLHIWQDARLQVSAIYACTGSETKSYRDFEFRRQLTGAALSVMNNIAEGFERKTKKDFAHFLDLAKGSSGEVRSMLYAGEDLKYLTGQAAQLLRQKAAKLSAGIESLAKHLRA